MQLFHALNEEIKKDPEGTFAPYYYRWLGFRREPDAAPERLRANGIDALFTAHSPVILKNEWFAGNLKGMFSTQEPLVLAHAKKTVESYGERSFSTNKDHFAPDYRRVLDEGLPAMLQAIERSMELYQDDAARRETLGGMKQALEAFCQMIARYGAAAAALKGAPGYAAERLELMEKSCDSLLRGKPQSFAEALQLVWFCHVAFLMEGRYAMALGRLDQYLYPFYRADRERGLITDEQVVEWLENIFIRLQEDVVNICIGGLHPDGSCAVNPLSRCILRAVGNCNVPGPNLSLRLTENTPDEFLDECLQVIGTGLGYPALMNDEVNLAALRRYGYAEEDLYDYCMVGCIENFISGKQPPWSDGRFDTPRFFDYLLNHGISRTHGSVGIDTGDLESIGSMEELMDRLELQLRHGAAEYVALFHKRNNHINQAYYPEPFLSCFCSDCIGRGLDINNGGSIYPSVHGVALMGIGTMSDSLAAIEKVVFTDGAATLAELRDALNADFEGYELLRQKLLAAPKYGNDTDAADRYAVWFVDFLDSLFAEYRTRDGGGIYIAAAANVSNIHAGRTINATPDGRKRGEPLSDAASPTYGRDRLGVTAVFNSLTKPDYTKMACGSVVNQKFSPAIFEDGNRQKLQALIRGYFKKGGQELQLNATSRAVLLDAMEHPENYGGLVVRVSGFSAFYTTLEESVQLDILNRTQQQ